eukprot:6715791-Karenia_brevis.AAC.1
MLHHGFACKKAAWRAAGGIVCRHGILFAAAQADSPCPCMRESSAPEQWQHALWMPSLDQELKAIFF